MPAAYSADLRKKIIDSQSKFSSMKEIANNFGVSYRFVKVFFKRYREEGTIEPKEHRGGRNSKINPEHEQFIIETLSAENDLSLGELCRRIYEKYSLSVSVPTMHRTIKKLEISRKKKIGKSGDNKRKKQK